MFFPDFYEAERRGIRAFVRATQPETRNTRGGRMDLPSRIRRTYRMGYADLHRYGYTVLVAWTIVLGMDVSRPICNVVKQNKVNKNKNY